MKSVAKILALVLQISFLFLIMSCGSDPALEGEKAFQDGNYNLAIKHFLEAKKNKSANATQIDEKISLSYMLRGKELYNRTNNIKSFSGNFEKGQEYLPENPSQEFKKGYSEILFDLGNAYINVPPENEIQKEEYLNKSITYLEDALYQDHSNSQADSLIQKIKADNFQKMLNKGNDFYTKARNTRNSDHYLTAEYYFQRAVDFDIYNQEAQKMLSATRNKTLSILNNREDFAMAVADMSRQKNHMILDLTIKNYATEAVTLKIENFIVSDIDGNTYQLDMDMMGSKFKDKHLKDQKLDELKSVDGIIAFSVPSKVKIKYLGYQLSDEEIVKKYFP